VSRTVTHRPFTALAMVFATLTACGPAPDAAPPAAEPVAAEARPDPVSGALSGSAQRALERRLRNARVILVDQVVSLDRTRVCGRYLLLTRDTRREQFFIVSATDLVELRKNTDRRWIESCSDADPLPGSLDSIGAEAQAASLRYP